MRHPDGVPRSPRPPDHTGYRQVREYEGDQCRSELARPLDAHDRVNNGARDCALPAGAASRLLLTLPET
jgi:hypothetical protein